MINENFWKEEIYPKIKNLNKVDQSEVITEIKDSDFINNSEVLIFVNDILADYNYETKLDYKLCLGSDISKKGVNKDKYYESDSL